MIWMNDLKGWFERTIGKNDLKERFERTNWKNDLKELWVNLFLAVFLDFGNNYATRSVLKYHSNFRKFKIAIRKQYGIKSSCSESTLWIKCMQNMYEKSIRNDYYCFAPLWTSIPSKMYWNLQETKSAHEFS